MMGGPLLLIDGAGDGAAMGGVAAMLGVGADVGRIETAGLGLTAGVIDGIGDGNSEGEAGMPGVLVISGAGAVAWVLAWVAGNRAVPIP
jgi:hypothetical protein